MTTFVSRHLPGHPRTVFVLEWLSIFLLPFVLLAGVHAIGLIRQWYDDAYVRPVFVQSCSLNRWRDPAVIRECNMIYEQEYKPLRERNWK